MLIRFLTASALSFSLALVATPAAFACGDEQKEAAKSVPADAQTVTLKIVGMSCGGCADSVRNALLKLDGVYDAAVSFETGIASVQLDGKKVDEVKLTEAIVKAGYKVEKPKG